MSGILRWHLRGAEVWSDPGLCTLDNLAYERDLLRLRGGAAPAMEGLLRLGPLDSGVPDHRWHRVFLDVALPPGCAISVAAFTSNTIVTDILCDPIGELDRRPLRADLPLPNPVAPPMTAPPASPEPLAGLRLETLEGLLPTDPGRWLWLVLRLSGTRRRAPALLGVRVTGPRPSLLDHLPAFWGRHPERDALERMLALFEAPLTELGARLDALPRLLDPASAPAEALPWLAGLLGLGLDPRLPEPCRRQFLLEAGALYRRRGTVGCLERVCSLVVGDDVKIVEHFRLRSPGAVLGRDAVGPAFQLDGDRALAHRYTVVVPRPRDGALEEILRGALDAFGPAHAAPELLWQDQGTRLGRGSLLALTTLLSEGTP